MIKALTVIGARPQFIKAAAISRAIRTKFADQISEIIVHTGQHYDKEMSEVFFNQMGIPRENYNLQVGSGSHAVQTAKIMIGLEEVLLKEQPDLIILYGDTNSTLAGAVVASKLAIPIVHIEAGMRSFTKEVPEEINRIMCDHVSTVLFTPTPTGAANLYREGFEKDNKGPYHVDNPRVYQCGDIMYDNSLYFREVALKESRILEQHQLEKNKFVLVTVHRQNNTDDLVRLKGIFDTLESLSASSGLTFLVPLHPRTKNVLLQSDLNKKEWTGVQIVAPVGYIDMIMLEAAAYMVITDSGGVQKEAYYFEKPCVILQNETPWVELVDNGCALLADADPKKISSAFNELSAKKESMTFPPVFGDGKAAEFTIAAILDCFKKD